MTFVLQIIQEEFIFSCNCTMELHKTVLFGYTRLSSYTHSRDSVCTVVLHFILNGDSFHVYLVCEKMSFSDKPDESTHPRPYNPAATQSYK